MKLEHLIHFFFHLFWSLTDIGEDNDELLLSSEIETMRNALSIPDHSVLKTFKDLIQTHGWLQNEHICEVMKKPLMRLCARYLYIEKRRGFALNPVGMLSLNNECCFKIASNGYVYKCQGKLSFTPYWINRLYIPRYKIHARDIFIKVFFLFYNFIQLQTPPPTKNKNKIKQSNEQTIKNTFFGNMNLMN